MIFDNSWRLGVEIAFLALILFLRRFELTKVIGRGGGGLTLTSPGLFLRRCDHVERLGVLETHQSIRVQASLNLERTKFFVLLRYKSCFNLEYDKSLTV